ncbi:MAG: (deoxy)nucleoside triphosphate pyrophosphohydrolase [Clostridia bacterium]|nr:(deoxy)nucleoside triphosphate pyrophosphohydrolase [Clostridia bacterium]
MVQVAAALIRDGDRFMICQRPRTKTRALEWEFVGGKAEPGETLQEALVRECREELGVTVTPGEIFMELDHVYPDITIHLTLFNAVIASGTVQMLEHNDIRWITPAEIDKYEFCPADAEILQKLKSECNKK